MKKKEVYYGALHTKVQLIDWTPINEVMSKSIGFDVETRLGKGFIPDVEADFNNYLRNMEDGVDVRSLILDNECCAVATKKENFYISDVFDKPFNSDLFKEVPFYKKRNKDGVSMFAQFFVDIDVDDIKKCLTGEEISLFEFMKGRYQYNPRISVNEYQMLKLLYQEKPTFQYEGEKRKFSDTVEIEV